MGNAGLAVSLIGLRSGFRWATLHTMSLPEDITSLSWEDLVALVAQLQRKVQELEASVQELQTEVERLIREKKRQAAPFSKGSRVSNPKRPGRKPSSGTFSFRQAPKPEEITESPVEVPVTLEACPGCGGKLAEERVDLAYITDLPPRPRPRVTQYRVWVCCCLRCGQRVRGQHPDLAPDQYGATAHRVGQRALAAAHTLHYQMGIPVRKVPAVLGTLTGLKLTQGAITQDALRWASGKVGIAYRQLRRSVRESPVVYTDDTGWRVGGQNAHLMAFDTDEVTVYQVRPRHRHQEVQEVVPADYPGVMVTDRGRSYEAHSFRKIRQQKCLAHLQKTLSVLLEKKKGRARELGENLKVLRGYHQRGELLRFLEQPEVEPTNNRVERMLRPAVIARKVSQCSKTWSGAEAFATFTSVIQTLLKKGAPSSVAEALADLFRAPQSQTTTA